MVKTAASSWPDVLGPLVAGQNLDASSTTWAMEEILSGNATPAQIAGFAIALRAKGETIDEVQGLVDAMYRHAIPLKVEGRAVDIVGTGGDLAKTVNISTMSAVVIAGAGIRVVKHGNRAASSASGAADVLEELGVRLDVPPTKLVEVLEAVGITFCFAPVFHAGYRFTAVPRRELGVPTTFNFLGPLVNPAKPEASAIGVADGRMGPIMASVLARRGADAFVFRGDDGLDEITTTTTTTVWIADGASGSVSEDSIDPKNFGFDYTPAAELTGGDAAFNAKVFERVLAGEKSSVRTAVLLNAGAGIAAHEAASGDLRSRLQAGIDRATESIDSGSAAKVLDNWAKTTQTLV
ncbi:anthranilate phosphoribosyltransferase [Aeromicrobium panaciterrae]|uniref:Anthranilate phosphoribosyltransferase n=1 Tax=Aeromicrobium panaciterrae TaxID=363861 RepID=A0ABU1UPT6_9ACTN|nr:anthranilate phosphoribosyltransferase [Aeromicrobium panaciterrae]MDR7087192.1 anthranilate phosphoribosyltransferase [Aeromicrobium panaciterrae]